jgi:hypothetical protein
LQATLFDREMIVEHIRQDTIDHLSQDITSRYTLVAGNFFEAVPEGADCYIMKNVLMDWSDAEYLQLLHNCRQAMHKGSGCILVIESMISENSPFTRFFSLQMAMMMRAARHRTCEEHQALFTKAGFVLTQAHPLGLEQMLLEGRPVEQLEGELEQ